jgi:hypothetical protein
MDITSSHQFFCQYLYLTSSNLNCKGWCKLEMRCLKSIYAEVNDTKLMNHRSSFTIKISSAFLVFLRLRLIWISGPSWTSDLTALLFKSILATWNEAWLIQWKSSFLIVISLTLSYPLRALYLFNQVSIIEIHSVGRFLISFLIVHSQLLSILSPVWSSSFNFWGSWVIFNHIAQNLKSILIVELRDMYPLMDLFGEVKGNNRASGHLAIQSLIEPETIRIRHWHGLELKGGNSWT